MKPLILLTLLIIYFFNSNGQATICSWNIRDLGKTKSDEEINFIANIVKDFDIVAIQEVVAKDPGGSQAIARLKNALSRKGFNWDYSISDPTSSTAYKAERYAFLWKTARVRRKGDAWLEKKYHLEMDREPYFATFSAGASSFTLVSFHAVSQKRQPEKEIKYFKHLPVEYGGLNLVFLGDFNCSQSNAVFNPLKALGYRPVFIGQKTTLRQECFNGECLASEFDNIFINPGRQQLGSSGVILFYNLCENMMMAGKISDHVPVWVELL